MINVPNTVARVTVRLAQVASVLALLIVFALLAVLWIANSQLARLQQTLRPRIEQQLQATLGRDVRVGSVHIHGLNQIVFNNLAIADGKTFASGIAATAPSTRANINLLSLLLQRKKDPISAVSSITLDRPNVQVARAANGHWDYQDIIDRLMVAKNKTTARLTAQVVVNDGTFNLRDATGLGTQRGAIQQKLVGVRGVLSSRGGVNYAFLASARSAEKRMGTVHLTGDYSVKAGVTHLRVQANDIAVNEVTRFMPKNFPITFENGTAALRLSALIHSLPSPDHKIPPSELTAEVDLSGVGLRLHEMSAPIVATSGRMRLVHDPTRFPRGSRVEFINVKAQAGKIPLTLSGQMTGLNLFDLKHAKPQMNLMMTAAGDGPQFQQLFPQTKWLQEVWLGGKTKLIAEVRGSVPNLRIDGTLDNARIGIRELQLAGVVTAFHLQPGVTGAGKDPSLRVTARVTHAMMGDASYDTMQLSLSSQTAWHELAKKPLLRGSASMREAVMPWGTANDVRGEVTIDRNAVQFNRIHAGIFGGTVTADALTMPIAPKPGQIILSTNGSFRNIDISHFTQAMKIGCISGTGQGTLSLTLDDSEHLHITTDLQARNVDYKGKHASTLVATMQVDVRQKNVSVSIPSATAQTQYGKFVVTAGSYQRVAEQAGPGVLHLPVHGEQLNLQQFSKTLTGTAVIDGTVQGSIATPVLTAHATALNGSVIGRAFEHAQSDLTYSPGSLLLRKTVMTRPGMVARLVDNSQGFNPLTDLKSLNATLDLNGASVDDIASLFEQKSPWQIDGGVCGTVDVRYTDRGLELGGKVEIPDAVVQLPVQGGYALDLSRLGLTFGYAVGKIDIQDLVLEKGSSTVHAHGTGNWPVAKKFAVDLDFNSTQAKVEDLPLDMFGGIKVPISGDAQIVGSLHGTLDGSGTRPLVVNADITSSQLALIGLPLGQSEVELQYRHQTGARELIISHATAGHAGFQVAGAGQFFFDANRMDGVKLTVDNIDLAKLQKVQQQLNLPVSLTLPAGMAGHGQIALTANGPMKQPQLGVNFGFQDLALAKTPLPDLQGQLRGESVNGHYRLLVDRLSAETGGVKFADVHGSIDLGKGVDLQIAVNHLTAKQLAPWVAGLPLDGQASFTGALHGPWAAPVLEGDAAMQNMAFGGQAIPQANAHIRLDRAQFTLSKGSVQLLAGAQPLQMSGTIPIRWDGMQFSLRKDGPVSLAVSLPQQQLAALRPLLPQMVNNLTGTVSGGLKVTGTLGQPRITDGWLDAQGAAGFSLNYPGFANSIQDLNLHATIDGDLKNSHVTLQRFTASLNRLDHGKPVKGFEPGYLAAAGAVDIPNGMLTHPQHWHWNVSVEMSRVSLPASVLLVPHASGAFQVVSDGSMPLVKGVVLLEDMKLKQPKMTAGSSTWGPFPFDPRLAIAIYVGGGVKISSSIFSVPLSSTPLPAPQIAVEPGFASVPTGLLDAYDGLLHQAGTSIELTGTWGAITGTLNDPQVYARFEVDKHHLSFPLNLIGSVKHAKGHVTYTKSDGPKIVMGIPDLTRQQPTAKAPAQAPALSLR